MNVLKPQLRITVETLLKNGATQREIERRTGVDRKTIRKIQERSNSSTLATGSEVSNTQNAPPRPPDGTESSETKIPKHAMSACAPHQQWIEEQVRLGRNAQSIYQDLVETFGFTHKYNSVKRFVRRMSCGRTRRKTMAMSTIEIEKALKNLRLSGMVATLEARALQVASHEMDFIEALGHLVQDELDRRRSRLLDRRYALSGLSERKFLKDIDWSYNPKIPKRDCLELGTLKFIEAKEDVLLVGQPGTAKSHVAKALALLAVERGYKVMYREAHELVGEIIEARELGEIRKYRAQLRSAELLVIDDLFLRRLVYPPAAISFGSTIES